jgi:hypothetical protein
MADKIKSVVWTISNAVIVPGFGEKAVKDQPIFEIKGQIVRDDSTTGPAKGETFKWTPNRKASGFTLDLSGFDVKSGKGTIKVNGTVKVNGRRGKVAATGKSLTDLLALA